MRRIFAIGTALLVGGELLAAWLRPGDTGAALGVAVAVALGTVGWAGLAGTHLNRPDDE